MPNDTAETATADAPKKRNPRAKVTGPIPNAKKNVSKAARKVKAVAKKAATANDTKSVIDSAKYAYQKSDDKTPGGRRCVDTNDRLAAAMRGLGVDDLKKVFKENKLDWKDRWNELNPGMARMNVGNVLRGVIKKGTSVKIAGKSIASL